MRAARGRTRKLPAASWAGLRGGHAIGDAIDDAIGPGGEAIDDAVSFGADATGLGGDAIDAASSL